MGDKSFIQKYADSRNRRWEQIDILKIILIIGFLIAFHFLYKPINPFYGGLIFSSLAVLFARKKGFEVKQNSFQFILAVLILLIVPFLYISDYNVENLISSKLDSVIQSPPLAIEDPLFEELSDEMMTVMFSDYIGFLTDFESSDCTDYFPVFESESIRALTYFNELFVDVGMKHKNTYYVTKLDDGYGILFTSIIFNGENSFYYCRDVSSHFDYEGELDCRTQGNKDGSASKIAYFKFVDDVLYARYFNPDCVVQVDAQDNSEDENEISTSLKKSFLK